MPLVTTTQEDTFDIVNRIREVLSITNGVLSADEIKQFALDVSRLTELTEVESEKS